MIRLLILVSSFIAMLAARQAVVDPPCNGWMLHTRTLPTICPELVTDVPAAIGAPAIWGLAFGANGDLYFTRPAAGQVMRMVAHEAHFFDPPQVIADGLDFPNGIACAPDACYVTTQTDIVRVDFKDGTTRVIFSGLAAQHIHPLHIGADHLLYTIRGRQLIRLATDGSGVSVVSDLPDVGDSAADFDWAAHGEMWASDGSAAIHSADSVNNKLIAVEANSQPAGLAFYHGAAFPQLANGLLCVTSGSYNALTFTGYALLFIPFDNNGQPGSVTRLIPADTDRTLSDAALSLLTFFPQHPIALAISPQGWIYIALREGEIVRLRPRVNA